MIQEIIVATGIVTIVRLGWIIKKPVHKDITSYIFPGLTNLRKILRYYPDFSYVPYGLIWYAVNVPIIRLGRYSGRFWTGALVLIDGGFLLSSFQSMGLIIFVAYLLIGTFQALRAPWNVSIDWLIISAALVPSYGWLLLALAPIAKFPIGLPFRVWTFTRRAIGHQHNFIYFGLLGTLWAVVFTYLYLPSLEIDSIVGLGVLWVFVLGYAYFETRSQRPTSE